MYEPSSGVLIARSSSRAPNWSQAEAVMSEVLREHEGVHEVRGDQCGEHQPDHALGAGHAARRSAAAPASVSGAVTTSTSGPMIRSQALMKKSATAKNATMSASAARSVMSGLR